MIDVRYYITTVKRWSKKRVLVGRRGRAFYVGFASRRFGKFRVFGLQKIENCGMMKVNLDGRDSRF